MRDSIRVIAMACAFPNCELQNSQDYPQQACGIELLKRSYIQETRTYNISFCMSFLCSVMLVDKTNDMQ
jgi:hypothetical protein